ncbi:hypothetical protein ABE61_11210 [Lysinibacillus sphaericus]|nr:hypothetical protein [Lysinibacillus sphaericus]MBG9478521.1 hypothetical protein [Lysinibacillus sphaericus]MBG9592198.1 hypothetical protein [Lysinibacillus sphaericus]
MLLLLTLRFRTEQSFLGASDEPLGATDVFCAKAQCNVAAATDVFCAKAQCNVAAATDVFCAKAQCNVAAATGCWSRKALSQDVMFLAFVPLYARSRVSGQQMFFARKRSANEAAAESFVCVKAQRQHRCWSRRRYHRM